jgi:hypothetical protein
MRALVAALCLVLVLAGPARAQGAFVAGIEDLPLMPGLVAQGEASVFEAPQGRVVEASAQGPAARAAVLEFYARTLAQLGWRADGEGRFAREGERLSIEFPAGAPAGATLVRFFLRPE